MNVKLLFSQILASPHNNALRRSYADAIEASDPVHADLIRRQVTSFLVRDQPGAYPLHSHIDAILAEHRLRIAGEVAGLCDKFLFDRGFVEHVEISATAWLVHVSAIKTAAPVLDVTLVDPARAPELFSSPTLAGLRALGLRSAGVTDAHVEALAENPHGADLLWLNLSANNLSERSIEAIAASPFLDKLQWLGFFGNACADPTPEVYTDQGHVTYVEWKSEGKALEAKYGAKAWISAYIGTGTPLPRDLRPKTA